MNGKEDSLLPRGSVEIFFLDFRILTFSNLMESNGRVDSDRGDFAEKIERDIIREGSMKAGEFLELSSKKTTTFCSP